MKAYFKGLGMSGVIDIPDKRPEYFVPIPKEMALANILSADMAPDKADLMTAKFMYMGMMPVFELVNIK